MNSQVPAPNMEELEPQIVKEVWCRYELADGDVIRVRTIVVKILWPRGQDPTSNPNVQIGVATLPVVAVFSRHKGPPAPNMLPEQLAAAPKQEVRIVNSVEDWSVYRIPGKNVGVKLKTTAVNIFRVTDAYDTNGDPVYSVNHQTVMGPVSSSELP